MHWLISIGHHHAFAPAADRRNLQQTLATLRPRLIILDPFVRLHRIDDTPDCEVAPLLAYDDDEEDGEDEDEEEDPPVIREPDE